MIPVLSVENMRRSDAYTISHLLSSRELMFRAGKSVFQSCKWQGDICIVCGSGNNAGDGYVLACLLAENGLNPHLLLLNEDFSPDGRYYFDKCRRLGVSYSIYDGEDIDADFIVDCLFGTGFHGHAEGRAADFISTINKSDAFTVSVDINSGLGGNTGRGDPVVKSDLTVSIGSYQPGHFIGLANEFMKHRVNCDIGIKPVETPYELYLDPSATAVDILKTEISSGRVQLVSQDELLQFGFESDPPQAVRRAAQNSGVTTLVRDGLYIISNGKNIQLVRTEI